MSDIYIKRDHNLDQEHIRDLAEQLASDIQARVGGSYRWEGDNRMHFKHVGVDGKIDYDESQISVEVVLGFLMKGLKGMLEREIHDHLDDHLNT